MSMFGYIGMGKYGGGGIGGGRWIRNFECG